LSNYTFPSNVHELRSVLERALVLQPGPELDLDLLAGTPAPIVVRPSTGFQVTGPTIEMEELERRYARYVLDQMGGRCVEAARALGISYPTFLKRIGHADDDEGESK
jgi:DNA-binding NtrC family response regulator